MDVLSAKVFNVGDKCFFLVASVNEPSIYLRCFGEIVKKKIWKDTVSYFIAIEEIFEPIETVKQFLHRKTFRMWHINADRGDLKEITCFENILNWETFNRTLSQKLKHNLFTVPSVFAFETKNEMTLAAIQTVSIMKTELVTTMNLLKSREVTLSSE